MEVLRRLPDVSHEGAEADVLAVAQHVHSILAGLLGPVAHITGAIALVITFDLGLRRALHGEACQQPPTLSVPWSLAGGPQGAHTVGLQLTQGAYVIPDGLHHEVR